MNELELIVMVIMGVFTVLNALITVWGLTRCNQRELSYQKQLYEQIQYVQEQRLIDQKQLSDDRSTALRAQYLEFSNLMNNVTSTMTRFESQILQLAIHIENIREQNRIRSHDDDRYATQKFPSVK